MKLFSIAITLRLRHSAFYSFGYSALTGKLAIGRSRFDDPEHWDIFMESLHGTTAGGFQMWSAYWWPLFVGVTWHTNDSTTVG